jgi:hypothetical protein
VEWALRDRSDGAELFEVDETTGVRRPVDGEEAQVLFRQYAALLGILADIEGGMVGMSFAEYRRLPAVFVDALRLFRKIKRDSERDNLAR